MTRWTTSTNYDAVDPREPRSRVMSDPLKSARGGPWRVLA